MRTPSEQQATELDVRASDAEREHVIEALRRHTADGRLTPDELSERIDAVYAARTVRDLRAPLADLPADPRPVPARPRHRSAPLGAAVPLAGVGAIVIAAWLTGAWWLLWLLWPLLALTSGGERGGHGCRRGAVPPIRAGSRWLQHAKGR